jgi:pectinesterase
MKSLIKPVVLIIILGQVLSLQIYAETLTKDTTYTVYQTYVKLKKKYPFIQPATQIQDKTISYYEDKVYKTVSGEGEVRELHADVYVPVKKGKYPALIMIHGGGWRSGSKVLERPMAQRIASEGFVTVPVEYRLSPEARYPAAIHDIKAAIRYVKDNAAVFNVDTTKVAVMGESAGGHLAMLTAMTNGLLYFDGDVNGCKSTSVVHAAIDIDGVVDFLSPNSLNIERKPDSPDAYWLGGIFAEKPLIWKEASPIYYVGKNSVPTLFVTSSVPRFHAGRDEMIDLLNQNNIYSESYMIPDTPHSFWLFDPWLEPTKSYIIKFMKKVFQN